MRRWTFYFEEGNFRSDISTDEEDNRIKTSLNNDPKGLLCVPGDNFDVYLNLSMVKCIAAQPLTQEQLDDEKAAKEQSTQVPTND